MNLPNIKHKGIWGRFLFSLLAGAGILGYCRFQTWWLWIHQRSWDPGTQNWFGLPVFLVCEQRIGCADGAGR